MKRVLLFLALILTASAGWHTYAMNDKYTCDFLPEVSTAEAPQWYVLASFSRGGVLTISDTGTLTHVVAQENSYWRFESAPGENAYYAINANGQYLSVSGPSDTPQTVYLLPNGANRWGISISRTNPISGSSCIDANNYNNGCGTWSPSASDWQGTTWICLPKSDAPVVSTAENPYWFTFQNPIRDGYLTAADETTLQHTPECQTGSLWRFESAGEDNAYYIVNQDGNYLNNRAMSTEKAKLYVIPGSVNGAGYLISTNSAGNSSGCYEISNSNSSIVAWSPSNADWDGSYWYVHGFSEVYQANVMSDLPAIFNPQGYETELEAYKNEVTINTVKALADKGDLIKAAWNGAAGKVVTLTGNGRNSTASQIYLNDQFKEVTAPNMESNLNAFWTVYPTNDGHLTFLNEYTGKWLGTSWPALDTAIPGDDTPGMFDIQMAGAENTMVLHPSTWNDSWSYHNSGSYLVVRWYTLSGSTVNTNNSWVVAPVPDETVATAYQTVIDNAKNAINNVKNLPVVFPTDRVAAIEAAIAAIDITKTDDNRWIDVLNGTLDALTEIYTNNPLNDQTPFTMKNQGAGNYYAGIQGTPADFVRVSDISANTVWKLIQVPGTLDFKLYNPAADAYAPVLPQTTDTRLAPATIAAAGLYTVYSNGENVARFNFGATNFNAYGQIQASTGMGAFSWWDLAPVSLEDIQESAEEAMNAAKPAALNAIETLKALGVYTDAELKAMQDAVNDLNPEINDVEDALAAAGNVVLKQTLNSMLDRPIYIINQRRNNSNKPAYLTSYANNCNTAFIGTSDAEWYIGYSGANLFNLHTNLYDAEGVVTGERYIAPNRTLVPTALEAGTFSIEAVSGAISFKDSNNNNGLNIDNNGNALTSWSYNDSGSLWLIAQPSQLPETGNYAVSNTLGGTSLGTAIAAPMAGDIVSTVAAQTLNASNFPTYDQGTTIWGLEQNGETFALKNYINGLYLSHDLKFGGTADLWTIISTDGAIGVQIAASADATEVLGLVNGKLTMTAPGANALWNINSLKDNVVAQFDEAASEAQAAIAGLMVNVVNGFYGLPQIWNTDRLDEVMDILNSEDATDLDKAEAFASVATEGDGKVFSVANARYYATLNNIGDKGSLNDAGLANVPNHGALLTMSDATHANSTFTGGATTLWQFSYAGSGQYLFGTYDGSKWAKADFTFTDSKDDAAPLYILNITPSDNVLNTPLFSLSVDATPADATTNKTAMHLNGGNLTHWGTGAAASKFFITMADDVNVTDGIYTIAAFNRGGVLNQTNQFNMSQDPTAWNGQHGAQLGLGFWQFQPAGDGSGAYTLYNVGSKAYLTPDLKMSDTEAGVWFIQPNGVNNYGVTFSLRPEITDYSCIDAASGSGLSKWAPAEDDWYGTTWVLHECTLDGAFANILPELQTQTVKTNATTWMNNYGGYADAFTWGKTAFLGEAGLAELFTDFNLNNELISATFGDNLFDAVMTYNFLPQSGIQAFETVFYGDMTTAPQTLINVRRTNNGRANTAIGVNDADQLYMVNIDNVAEDESTKWTFVKKGDNNFVLVNNADQYMKVIDKASQPNGITYDEEEATLFTGKGILTLGTNNGTAIKIVDNNWGLNADNNVETKVVNYAYTDGGSTWRIIPATTGTSGVQDIDSDLAIDLDDENTEIYNLQGIRVNRSNISTGIYIVRQGNNVAKIAVK